VGLKYIKQHPATKPYAIFLTERNGPMAGKSFNEQVAGRAKNEGMRKETSNTSTQNACLHLTLQICYVLNYLAQRNVVISFIW
jgi:hypothetical protein